MIDYTDYLERMIEVACDTVRRLEDKREEMVTEIMVLRAQVEDLEKSLEIRDTALRMLAERENS